MSLDFGEHQRKRASKIRPGDLFLCYLTGVKMWVGLLEVTGDKFEDNSPIWVEEVFPIRFPVKPLVMLKPEYGVPMDTLKGKLSFFPTDGLPGSWSGLVRGSPTKYKISDGEIISAAIKTAEANPILQKIDAAKLKRPTNLYKLHKKVDDQELETVVTVPTEDEEEEQLDVTEVWRTNTYRDSMAAIGPWLSNGTKYLGT